MKNKFNFILAIIALTFVGLFDLGLWKDTDPNTLSPKEKENFGLTKVHNVEIDINNERE